jgi:hypothetical protein
VCFSNPAAIANVRCSFITQLLDDRNLKHQPVET